MNPRVAHWLVRLYPSAWRERYGEEFEAVLQAGPGDIGTSVNVLRSALSERVIPTTRGRLMDPAPRSVIALAKQPSAYIPLAMSLTALAMVLGNIAIYGIVRDTDEGAVAHLWQILMAAHLPIAALFAIKWLPRATKSALLVLAMLAGALAANLALVYFCT